MRFLTTALRRVLRKGNERSSMPSKPRLTAKADKRLRAAKRARGSSAPTEAAASTPSVPPLPAAPAEVIEAAPPTAPAAPRTMDPEEMDRGWWTDKCRLCGQRDGLLYPREICWVCEVRTMPPPAGSREEARALEQAHEAVRRENLLDTHLPPRESLFSRGWKCYATEIGCCALDLRWSRKELRFLPHNLGPAWDPCTCMNWCHRADAPANWRRHVCHPSRHSRRAQRGDPTFGFTTDFGLLGKVMCHDGIMVGCSRCGAADPPRCTAECVSRVAALWGPAEYVEEEPGDWTRSQSPRPPCRSMMGSDSDGG